MGKLHEAAKVGDVKKIRKLAKGGFFKKATIPVNEVDMNNDRYTALHWAAYYGQIEAIRCLVKECGADVNIKDRFYKTALLIAVNQGQIEAIRCLVKECGAESVDEYNTTALHIAAQYGRVEAIRCLVKECGADVNSVDGYNTTALHMAASNGHVEVIRCLVKECGAEVNIKDKGNETALHRAASNGHGQAICCLVKECGADVNIRGKDNNTALHVAARNGNNAAIRYLVEECGADLTIKNHFLETAKQYATDYSVKELLVKLELSNQDKHKQSLLQQGEALLAQSQYDKAEQIFDKLLVLEESNVACWYGKGRALVAQQVVEQALECFDQVLKLQPFHFEACQAKVNLLLRQNDQQAALSCYDNFLKLSPSHTEALKAIIALLVKQGNKQEVLKCYDMFLKRNPTNLEIFQAKISLLLEQGNIGEVLVSLDAYIKQQPKDKLIIKLKGYLLRYEGRYAEAVTHYANVLENQTNDKLFTCLMGDTYVQQKQLAKAELLFNKILNQDTTFYLALQGKGFAELNKNKRDTALDYFVQAEKSAKSEEELASLFYERGQVYQAWNMLTEAKACYEKVLQYDPQHLFAKLCLTQLGVSPINSAETKVPSVSASVENMNDEVPSPRFSKQLSAANNPSFTISYHQLTMGNKIGEGAYGIVFKGTWSNTEVAIKQLKNSTLTQEALSEFNGEVQLMANLRHKHIVQLYGAVTEKEPYCMVMEYMGGGSLYKLLHSSISISWDKREQIALDVAKGLNYLHENKILHRDLKSLNVLLDENQKAKICDFGLAKVKHETASTTKNADMAGTLAWMAPELFDGEKCSQASDMYSYGMVVWEIAARDVPFKNLASPQLIPFQVMKRDLPETIPVECNQQAPKLAHLIQFCWQKKPAERISANKAIKYLEASGQELASDNSYQGNLDSFKQPNNDNNSYQGNLQSLGK